MKKSVYSLVLMDDVVEAVDRLAYSLGTSRSNLINQILAEHVALTTPEMQMKTIFDTVQGLLNHCQHFQIQPQAADSMMSIRSVLKYKYNPTIRYAITLFREDGPVIGEIKVISRSQSEVLQTYLSHFFEIWTQYEKEQEFCGWETDQSGRWTRRLNKPMGTGYDATVLANTLADYIQVIDEGLKIYCSHLDTMPLGKIQLYKHFSQYCSSQNYYI
ncbi:MAG: CopG family transcriptional regulator [Cellulosilyticaceae bacterium]